MRLLSLVGLIPLLLADLAPTQPVAHPTDPHRIADVVGVSTRSFVAAQCNWSRATASFTCVPEQRELSRLIAERGSWVLTSDPAGALYAGSQDWSIPPDAVPARRDSIAQRLNFRGLIHQPCADTVDRVAPEHPTWLSTWIGPEYSAVIFHRVDGGHVQLTIQVARGEPRPCGVSSSVK